MAADEPILIGQGPPIRRILPWWFVAGALVTSLVLALLGEGDGGTATVLLWGVLIGITVRERWSLVVAAEREGGSFDFRRLGRSTREPLVVPGLTALAVGVGLLVGNLWPDLDGPRLLLGAALAATGALHLGVVFRTAARPDTHRRQSERRRTDG